jgi:FkbM family methyltransferase
VSQKLDKQPEPYLCVPLLSLLLLCWFCCRRVDLLKVDVERAELQVLQGVQQQHWPLIQQLALEVRAACCMQVATIHHKAA